MIDLGEETLKETSKSLLVAVRMTEALTMKHGLSGVRDGFRLLRRMTDEAWDRLQPVVEEPDDLEIRAGMYNWLDDPLHGALYPHKLRAVPLLFNGATPISYVTCRGRAEARRKSDRTRSRPRPGPPTAKNVKT